MNFVNLELFAFSFFEELLNFQFVHLDIQSATSLSRKKTNVFYKGDVKCTSTAQTEKVALQISSYSFAAQNDEVFISLYIALMTKIKLPYCTVNKN